MIEQQEAPAKLAPERLFAAFEHSITWEDDIWRADPVDVAAVHAKARSKFGDLLSAITNERGSGKQDRILLFHGQSGAGKTHLIRALRTAAHRSGVVHCDIKPDNILVGSDGVPRITDFGLAGFHRIVSRRPPVLGAESSDPEQQGSPLCGTLGYIAPECYRGAAPAQSRDIYAIGVTLYQLLSGEPRCLFLL